MYAAMDAADVMNAFFLNKDLAILCIHGYGSVKRCLIKFIVTMSLQIIIILVISEKKIQN